MRLHHVAYVTPNLEKKAAMLTALLGFRPAGGPVVDPVQGVRIQFMETGENGLVELMEPHGEKSPVQRFLKKGGGLYHLCFEVEDLEGTLQRLRDTGEVFVVCEPVPAPAIGGRRVAFVVTSDRDLIEFLEAVPKMSKDMSLTQRVDEFWRRHPHALWLANGSLMVLVTLVLLTATDTPVVLYQAF